MREELEATLATSWTAENLSVYADWLQGQGDPRGELIALDLADRGDVDLEARRAAVIKRWLGAKVAARLPEGCVYLGFISGLVVTPSARRGHADLLSVVLDSPAGPYLRGVVLKGGDRWLVDILPVLARVRHRWLDDLAVLATGYGSDSKMPAGIIDDVIAATPALRTLTVESCHWLRSFRHPAVETLRAWESLALVLSDRGEPWNVSRLDLRERGFTPGPQLRRERFPALVRLDLSRNRPHDVPRLLAELDLCRDVEEVTVPHATPRERLPAGRANLAFAAPRPTDAMHGDVIGFDAGGGGDVRVLGTALDYLIAEPELLPERNRAARQALVDAFATLEPGDRRAVPGALVLRAFATFNLDRRKQAFLRALRARLAADPRAEVTLRRWPAGHAGAWD